MKLTTLTRVGWKHAKNALAEEAYLRTNVDVTKPITFYAQINERCNVKCRFCEFWRMEKYVDEMSIEQWQRALLSIREFVGEFVISFSGGEPFIKKGFIDLMEWCHENGIHAGVCTNGWALNEALVTRLVNARPFNVNISVDAPDAELHDHLRGFPGLHAKLTAGMQLLREARERMGLDFPIIVKPTMMAQNFRLLPQLVEWATANGATAVSFQPLNRWTEETYRELWIEQQDHAELQGVVDRLIEMKRQGAPILNSEQILSLTVNHFREESAPPEVMPCRVGLRDYIIKADGKVEVCFWYPPIGDVKTHSAREIWHGPQAQDIRRQTVGCEKLCLLTCLSQKTLTDKVKMGMALLRKRGRHQGPPAVALT